MGRRFGRVRRSQVAILAAWTIVAVGEASASGGRPRGNAKPAPPSNDRPEEVLPTGCARLADGHGPVLSPDGKRVAFGRGGTPPLADVTGEPTPPDLWLRDLKAGKEWPLSQASAAVAWAADGTLLLAAGYGVEAVKGARVPRAAALPSGATAIEVAWTRDGKRLAWVPRAAPNATVAVEVVGTDGKARSLAGTANLLPEQAAFLAFSPDGASLFVDALFRSGSEAPTRRVGVVDVATGDLRVLATMPDWIGIPGLRAGEPTYDDPRKRRTDGEKEIEWRRPTGPRWGRDVWSSDGRLVAWLAGETWTEADAYVADRTTGETWRVTVDGDVKWSPALDPSGRRLAYLTAEGFGRRARSRDRRVRVLDLWTGETTDLPLVAADGVPGSLAWTSGAYGVVYDLRDGPSARSFVQSVPPPKPAPACPQILRLEYTPAKRILASLGSKDADRLRLALRRADKAWDDEFGPALRAALLRWKDDEDRVASDLMDLIRKRQVRDAVPELRALLDSKVASVRVEAAGVLLAFGEADALDLLDGMRTKASNAMTRLEAAGALVRAGDDRGWPDLENATKSDDFWLRRAVVDELARAHQARSVDLLIPLVGDARRPSGDLVTTPPDALVGKAAQRALRGLTGQSLGDDPAAWKAWWTNEAKGVLPEVPDEEDEPDESEGPPKPQKDGAE